MYKLDKYAVTRGEWYQYCLASGYPLPETWNGNPPTRPHETITAVTWLEAVAYCKYYGCRLPNENEWLQAFNNGELADCLLYDWLLNTDRGTNRALRGGAWGGYDLAASRSSRFYYHLAYRNNIIAFRCLREQA